MKKNFYVFSAVCTLMLAALTSAAASTKEERRESLDSAFKNGMSRTGELAYESASMLGLQPDAYIGKLFPSIPAHFSAGISMAATFADSSFATDALAALSDIMDAASAGSGLDIQQNFNVPRIVPFPAIAATARIGGIFLPFDAGVFIFSTVPGMIKDVHAGDYNADIDMLTVGADLRYAVYEGNLFAPKVSVGGGYIFTRSKVALDCNFSKSGTYTIAPQSLNGTAYADSSIDTKINTHTLFAEVQVSKRLLVFTPYAGFKAMFSSVHADCSWDYNIYGTGMVGGVEQTLTIEKNGSNFSIDNKFDIANISPQLFGGVGIDALIVQFALNGAWNIRTNHLSAGLSINIKM